MENLTQPFNIEQELGKITISVPLVELVKIHVYQKQIEKVVHIFDFNNHPDTLHIHDEFPSITFGPNIDSKEEPVAPFFITLNIHDKLLHNCMIDSRACHNLMPKSVMQHLGLDITRPYHYLYSIDSRKVKCEASLKTWLSP
jgi:hypothetical protein